MLKIQLTSKLFYLNDIYWWELLKIFKKCVGYSRRIVVYIFKLLSRKY